MIDELLARIGRRTAYLSRGLSPALRRRVAAETSVVDVPLRGVRAVPIEPCDGVVVGGHPNELGGFDPVPEGGIVVVDPSCRGLRPLPVGAEAVTGPARWRDPAPLVPVARRLAKRLAQLRGVSTLGPEAPVVVALLPVVDGVDAVGSRVELPELPGGIRIVVEDTDFDVDARVDAVARLVAVADHEEERRG